MSTRLVGFDQSGFTLLEVLVAIIILAVGLLGLASLQATGLSLNQSAHFRTQATNLAYEMADRMRSNREAARDGDYDTAFASPTPACTDNQALNQNTVVARDTAAWLNSLACNLPSGNGAIITDGNIAVITVRWDDSRGEEDLLEFSIGARL